MRMSRHTFGRMPELCEPQDFGVAQRRSFEALVAEGILDALEGVFPISAVSGRLSLHLTSVHLAAPDRLARECLAHGLTLSRALSVVARLDRVGEHHVEESVFLASV